MKTKAMRDMTDDELRRESRDLRRTLFNLRLSHAMGRLEKPHQLAAARRDLARALTVLRERELKSAKEAR